MAHPQNLKQSHAEAYTGLVMMVGIFGVAAYVCSAIFNLAVLCNEQFATAIEVALLPWGYPGDRR